MTRTLQSNIPIFSLLVTTAFIFSSSHWLNFASNTYWSSYHFFNGKDKNSVARQWVFSQSGSIPENPDTDELKKLKWNNYRLTKENETLRKELNTISAYQKHFAADLVFLSTRLVGESSRIEHSLYILGAGQDLGVQENAYVLQDYKVIGKVIEIHNHNCLAQGTTSLNTKWIVNIGHSKENHLWEGRGDSRASIRIPESLSKSSIGKKVFLAENPTLGGGLLIGRVIGIREQKRGTMVELIATSADFESNQSLSIAQKREKTDLQSFTKRDELTLLKKRVRELEFLKLQAELLK